MADKILDFKDISQVILGIPFSKVTFVLVLSLEFDKLILNGISGSSGLYTSIVASWNSFVNILKQNVSNPDNFPTIL